MKFFLTLAMFCIAYYAAVQNNHSYKESHFGNQRLVSGKEYAKTHPTIALVKKGEYQNNYEKLSYLWQEER